jgi:putative transposase
MIAAVQARPTPLRVQPACAALGLARATYYRHTRPRPTPAPVAREWVSPRALTAPERDTVLAVLHEPRFADLAPAQVYAQLLDEGTYHCAVRTMYRVLAAQAEVRERRAQRRHPAYAAPELLATAPNQLWSWDITKLKGPVKWTWYHLYVLLDVFSRYVVGWLVADREAAWLAEDLIATSCARQGIARDQLTIHADRGTAMTSRSVALLFADLGITPSHSRPSVANDNPYSEAQFKTLKYRPDFPDRFGPLAEARAYCADLFPWYNTEHRHSAITRLTMCTTASPPLGRRSGLRCCRPHTPSTPNASSAGFPHRCRFPPRRGSTHPNSSRRQRTLLSKLNPPGVSNLLTASELRAWPHGYTHVHFNAVEPNSRPAKVHDIRLGSLVGPFTVR